MQVAFVASICQCTRFGQGSTMLGLLNKFCALKLKPIQQLPFHRYHARIAWPPSILASLAPSPPHPYLGQSPKKYFPKEPHVPHPPCVPLTACMSCLASRGSVQWRIWLRLLHCSVSTTTSPPIACAKSPFGWHWAFLPGHVSVPTPRTRRVGLTGCMPCKKPSWFTTKFGC